MKTNIHFWSYLTHFFLEWKMFQAKVVEEIEIHILYSMTIYENQAIYDNVKRYYGVGRPQMTMAHVFCILDT